jgi:hypothetical protein
VYPARGSGVTTPSAERVQKQRALALAALPRIADRERSELAGLWHEGDGGARFDALLAGLRDRLLEAGSSGPLAKPAKPKKGDVIALPAAPGSKELVIVQVLGPHEIAVFTGTSSDEATAIASVKTRPARRVPASANGLARKGRVLGDVPLRKELAQKKLYADEAGALEGYALSLASGGGLRLVSYDEARDIELLHAHDEAEICDIALGRAPPARHVRSPDEREAELVALHGERWARRRETTTPHPFGDLEQLERLVAWIEEYGLENALLRFHEIVIGASGYGRPNEESERRSYAFAGLVTVWSGGFPRDAWPAALASRLPRAPAKSRLSRALEDARALAAAVISRDAELRLIWDGAPDRGASFRTAVASLEAALAR